MMALSVASGRHSTPLRGLDHAQPAWEAFFQDQASS